jgi:hypothetical protein
MIKNPWIGFILNPSGADPWWMVFLSGMQIEVVEAL